jgi:hypothetical protein
MKRQVKCFQCIKINDNPPDVKAREYALYKTKKAEREEKPWAVMALCGECKKQYMQDFYLRAQ